MSSEEKKYLTTPPTSFSRKGAGKDTDEKKKRLNTLAIVVYMMSHPDWKRALRVNTFTETIQVAHPFPPRLGEGALTYRSFKEPEDLIEAVLWFQHAAFPGANKTLVWDAMTAQAHRNAYHPVQTYLDSLKWDGLSRLGGLFQHYFNAIIPEDATDADRRISYLDHISIAFMVSAVARIRQPGCKVDHAPVLVGPQGFNKSTAIAALCHDPAWFSDDLSPDLVERDTKESLVGKWIIELAEIPHVRREVNHVKAFFTRQTDRYRRAYDRRTGDWPRQCVFMGSTNDLEFVDATGNRRFWPVEIGGIIDTARIVADRDQLWAEATALYADGLKWWLSPRIELLAAEQQEVFAEEDVWVAPLRGWVAARSSSFLLVDAMTDALRFVGPQHITKADQNRAAGCLKLLGFKRRKRRVNGGDPTWRWSKNGE